MCSLTTATEAIFSLRADIPHRTRLSSWRYAIDAWCNAYARMAEASVHRLQQACENVLVDAMFFNR